MTSGKIPRMLRLPIKYNRKFLGFLCRSALRSLTYHFEAVTGRNLISDVIPVNLKFGHRLNLQSHLHFLITKSGVGKAGVFPKVSGKTPRVWLSLLPGRFSP